MLYNNLKFKILGGITRSKYSSSIRGDIEYIKDINCV